ncbi:MAG: hypothetical protein ABGY41_14790, partial [Candidatus Poribacteria bacterium]
VTAGKNSDTEVALIPIRRMATAVHQLFSEISSTISSAARARIADGWTGPTAFPPTAARPPWAVTAMSVDGAV